jgi:predicted nucleic acid-binding protein
MKYVVDASLAFKWEVVELHSDKVQQLRDDFRNAVHELLAPDLFPTEVAHALLVAERRGRILPGQGPLLLADVLTTLPRIYPSLAGLLPRAYAIAELTKASIYDCLYVALAEREKCELITADDKLVKKLQPHFSFVVSLASRP